MRATCLGDLQSGSLDDTYGLQFFVHAENVTESRDQQTTGALGLRCQGQRVHGGRA